MKKLKEYVIDVPNFPKEGIIFRDITGVLQDPAGLKLAVDSIVEDLKDVDFDIIVAPESRGFVFGVPVAYNMNRGFVPARKKGKLPRETVEIEYDLEYGSEALQLHKDSVKKGSRVVIVDDLIATGGTLKALAKLVESLGGEIVKICACIELLGLKGREVLKDYKVSSLIKYDGN